MRKYAKTDICLLLDRFMDGTTTLEEEDVLSNYFRQDDVPAEWENYRQLFAELEAMKPQTVQQLHPKRRWRGWSVAAAVAGLLLTTVIWQSGPSLIPPRGNESTTPASLIAQTDREDTVLRPEPPNQEAPPDTAAMRRMLEKRYPPKRKQRSLRKPEPTMLDYDKGYALLARMQQEREEVEQQIAQTRQEMIHARLTAAGYVAVQQEDGTIIYVDDPNEYFAYEE